MNFLRNCLAIFYVGISKGILEATAAQYNFYKDDLDLSYFDFKIRLGLSFQKQKLLYSNSQPTDSQSGVITITPKGPFMGERQGIS